VGYGEILPFGDGLRAAGPTRAHLLERLDALLPGAVDGGTDWRGHHLPLSTGRWHQPDGAVLLAGDALGLVNPLTGEGIHAAVVSGALAGLAAVKALRAGDPASAGARYRAALSARFGRHQRHMSLLAWATRRGVPTPPVLPPNPAGDHALRGDHAIRGAPAPVHREIHGRGRRLVAAALAAGARDQRVFDDLAEMGLAEGPLTGRVVTGLLLELARQDSGGGSRPASA
jgi:menaquinone-9 beta-reductase